MNDKVKVFWNKVIPDCVAGMSWGEGCSDVEGVGAWKKTLKERLCDLDEEELDLFLAQIVIKASGKGVVGKDLTGAVEMLKKWRK